MSDFSELRGQTLTKIEGAAKHSEQIDFYTASGKHFRMFHEQDCCESVWVEDVCGDVVDLIGSPLVQAEESSNCNADAQHDPAVPDSCGDSWTWTFYRLATAKGQVVLRWYGTSNGYYSESVSFEEVRP